jgi:hypothetical protein
MVAANIMISGKFFPFKHQFINHPRADHS